MKKTTIAVLVSGLLFISAVKAQTLQDGINYLYEEREQSAKALFEKLLAVNPNNIDATYWLGQTYIAMDNVPAARQVYEKALQASANAPLLIVGMGHVELLENKVTDAKQRFEAAITMTHTKKGDDPVILNAIGRANVDAKAGDLAYAIEKLKAAVDRDPKNADIFLNLGNAYRKARPGEGGGDAYTNYKKAFEVNPNFAIAYYRIAKLFETQQNWEIFLENENQAVAKDPGFAPAYYDLYYYYLGKMDLSTADDYAKKYIANTDPDVQNDYLRAQTLWAQKKFDEAIDISKSIISKAGDQTKPRTYKLLAYCFLGKGDTMQAKNYIDEYFTKAKEGEIIPPDYLLKANIYSGVPGNTEQVVKAFIDASNADTLLQGKIGMLQRGAELLRKRGERLMEGDLKEMIYKLKKRPGIRDVFDWGIAKYFGKDYAKADSVFGILSEKYPDSTYGWQWQARARSAIDTAMDQGLAVTPYQKLLEVAAKDSVRLQKEFLEAAKYLAGYFNNIVKDKDKALEYTNRILGVDPTNEDWLNIKKMLEQKAPGSKQTTTPKNNNTSGSGKTNGN
ncbi:MAG: tetratricopeptide repeat protein [Chitinophagales bacterium]